METSASKNPDATATMLQLSHGVSAVETLLASPEAQESYRLQLSHGVSAVETSKISSKRN